MAGNQLTSIGVFASIAFGALIAIMAMLGAGNLGLVAAIGGIVLGLMWVALGMIRRSRCRT